MKRFFVLITLAATSLAAQQQKPADLPKLAESIDVKVINVDVVVTDKKGVPITETSTFAGDLEFDSLTVMDFVAAIEDEFDIIISMNQQAEIENYGQLIDAVVKLKG